MWLVLPPYGFRSTLKRRSMFSACISLFAFELRVDYRFTPVRVTPITCTPTSAQRTVSASLVLNLIATYSSCRTRNKCVGTSSVQLSNKRTKLRRTLPSKYVLRTYNAQIVPGSMQRAESPLGI